MERTITPEHKVTAIADDSWSEMQLNERERGNQLAKEIEQKQGHKLHAVVVASKIARSADKVCLAAAAFDLDWRVALRLEAADLANELLTKLCIMGQTSDDLPYFLAKTIEGREIYKDGLGEFFQLYGKFEQKYDCHKGNQQRQKMEELINGDPKWLREYIDRGKKIYPLPYAVRQILVHQGHNPNTLDKDRDEIRDSVKLLKKWTE